MSDTADFAAQVEALRPQLLRFARSQLRNEAWAEDAVSETLLAALEKPHGFAGRSQDVPAWVNRFKQTPSLAGKQFGELTLSRDKEGRLAFQLSGIEREKP